MSPAAAQEWTPQPGDEVEVVLRGRVRRVALQGNLLVLDTPTGARLVDVARGELLDDVQVRLLAPVVTR